MEMLLPAIAIGGLTFGPYIGRLAYLNYRQAQRMATTETIPTRDVQPATEVEVAGTVATDTETFTSPVSETEAVCCVWRVDEWNERGKMSLWRTRATGIRSVPFVITDDYGYQPIDIGTHSYDLSSLRDWLTLDMTSWTDVVEVPPDETPPPSIQRFIENTAAVTPASDSITNIIDTGHKHGHRRYREAVLKPGDPCYALGTTDAEGMLTAESDDLIVGSGDEATVLARKQKRARRGGAAAIGSIAAGATTAMVLL